MRYFLLWFRAQSWGKKNKHQQWSLCMSQRKTQGHIHGSPCYGRFGRDGNQVGRYQIVHPIKILHLQGNSICNNTLEIIKHILSKNVKSNKKKSQFWKYFLKTFLIFMWYLDAFSHLYKRVCPSVRRSVGPLVTHKLNFWEMGEIEQNSIRNKKVCHLKDDSKTKTQAVRQRTHPLSELCSTCLIGELFLALGRFEP